MSISQHGTCDSTQPRSSCLCTERRRNGPPHHPHRNLDASIPSRRIRDLNSSPSVESGGAILAIIDLGAGLHRRRSRNAICLCACSVLFHREGCNLCNHCDRGGMDHVSLGLGTSQKDHTVNDLLQKCPVGNSDHCLELKRVGIQSPRGHSCPGSNFLFAGSLSDRVSARRHLSLDSKWKTASTKLNCEITGPSLRIAKPFQITPNAARFCFTSCSCRIFHPQISICQTKFG